MPEDLNDLLNNGYYIIKVIAFAVLYSIVFSLSMFLNNEELVENWSIGLMGMVIFSVLYIIPNDFLIFRIKKIHKMGVLFFLSWFIVDYFDFITTMTELIVTQM